MRQSDTYCAFSFIFVCVCMFAYTHTEEISHTHTQAYYIYNSENIMELHTGLERARALARWRVKIIIVPGATEPPEYEYACMGALCDREQRSKTPFRRARSRANGRFFKCVRSHILLSFRGGTLLLLLVVLALVCINVVIRAAR